MLACGESKFCTLKSKQKRLGYIEKILIYIWKIQYSLSRQGEACKDKIDAGKTHTVLACAESDSAQCYPILDFLQFFEKSICET